MLEYLTRRPRALVAMVATSAVLLGVSTVGYSAGVDAETRATLNTEIDHASASITRTVETGRAIVASHFTAATCVIEASDRLAPVATGGSPYAAAVSGIASTVVQRASDAAPVPAYDPAPPPQPSAEAGVDDLRVALAVLRQAEADAEGEVAALASMARHAEQDCVSARAAVRALVDEIASRTDGLIAERPKAAADTVSALRSARDAVVSGDGNGVETWLAAAAALESSHTAAVAAEQKAAAEARRAAEAAEAAETVDVSPYPVSFTSPWEGMTTCQMLPHLKGC